MMQKTPKGLRLHIAIFGRRNVGKSTILNALTSQEVSIVSTVPGTTTDPVEKPMELLPLGPVLFIDTAGIDDMGSLGRQRVEKTYHIFERAEIIILVTEANVWGEYEKKILEESHLRDIPCLIVLNKIDLCPCTTAVEKILEEKNMSFVKTCASKGNIIDKLKNRLIDVVPDDWIKSRPVISDLLKPGEGVILVIPIDKEAPKGRIILPQVQTLRDILDTGNNYALVTSELELSNVIANLKQKPALVITDSQAFQKVAQCTPQDIPVTSFSIVYGRYKGDLWELIEGARVIDKLKYQDRILILESCTHHPIGEDIGRIKIPKRINERLKTKLIYDVVSGHDFPSDLEKYKLIIINSHKIIFF